MAATAQAQKTRKRRSNAPKLSREEVQQRALANALADKSAANYQTIVEGFMEKGIEPEDITPRVNVFTYNAWRELGRQVRRGESGVRILSMAPARSKGEDGESSVEGEKPRMRPVPAVVFHITQTDPIEPKGE